MIDYDGGYFQLAIVCQLHGSVFPKACIFAVPATLVAITFHILTKDFEPTMVEITIMENSAAYSGFSFVVGFLLVFRTSQAYTRFWEGTTLMQLLRGQWVGAFSSILAFTSTSDVDQQAIDDFRHKLVRLFSLLHASALRYAATLNEDLEEFDVIGILGLDDNTINFIHDTSEDTKIYITIQWIQQLILANLDTGILPVPAPIISRVFQDLSVGIVTLNNARKISDTPFPFPYVQIMSVMLLMHMAITPFVVVTWCSEWYWSAVLTFVPIFAFWSINYIAAEIEQPFGGDVNDINTADLQTTMNKSLVAMLHPQVSYTPQLKMTAEFDRTNLLDKADTLSVAFDVIQRKESALKKVKPANRALVTELLKQPPSRQSWTSAQDTEPAANSSGKDDIVLPKISPHDRAAGNPQKAVPVASSVVPSPAKSANGATAATGTAGGTSAAVRAAQASLAEPSFAASAPIPASFSPAVGRAQLAALKELSDQSVVEPKMSLGGGELEFLQKLDAADRDQPERFASPRPGGSAGGSREGGSAGGAREGVPPARGPAPQGLRPMEGLAVGDSNAPDRGRSDAGDIPGRSVDGLQPVSLSVDADGFSLRMNC